MKLPRYILIDTSKLGSAGLEEAYFIQEKGIALDDDEALTVFKNIWECGATRGNDIDFEGWRPEYQNLINEYWDGFKDSL